MSQTAAAEQSDTQSPSNIISGAPEGQDARILTEKARALMPEDRALIHVALDDSRIATLRALLDFFAPDVEVITFPAWDCLPYDRVSPHNDLMAERMAALNDLMMWQQEQKRKPRILLTTINAVTQRVPPQESLKAVAFTAQVGARLDMEQLQSFLSENGYHRTDTVREAGEFAIRGGIIDLFPAGQESPVRIDLFGDEIDTIKTFDPETQVSQDKQDVFSLKPAKEYILTQDAIGRFRGRYREIFGTVRDNDMLYASVSEGRHYNGMEHWLPLFYESMDTLFDYAPKAEIVLDHHGEHARAERLTHIEDFYQARKTLAASQTQKKSQDVSLSGVTYRALPPDYLYLTEDEWQTRTNNAETLSPFPAAEDDAKKGRDFGDVRAQPDGDIFAALKDYLDQQNAPKTLITCYGEGSRDRIKGLMEHAGLSNIKEIDDHEQLKKLKTGQIGLAVLPLPHGFVATDLLVISEQDLLGDRMTRQGKKRKKADNFLKEVSSLDEGDLVVHIEHGIGRFEGLETVQAYGTMHDCLKLVYAGGDKLFVPVENIEVLSRFGGEDSTSQLDKLGGAGWQARKSKVKKDLMAIAGKLIDLAAARKLQKSDPLHIEKAEYDQFAARFPYAETDDQQRSIDNVIEDMGSDYPMDRLVCGDVGFGKTEVAIRATYIAAKAGVQVALVVPTTLLARQHYANFAARFEGTGIRVAQLSRMVGSKEAKLVKDGLQSGEINVVIGTHALFAKDAKFAHLGLLIVDEEQRFGVKQKEKLKELKENVHVLTLTATPIPRTLQMSLSGVRDLSLITTPPIDRLAIRTFTLPYDPMVIREALLREHYRGGQSFYVCPRVKDMAELEEHLKELVPELKLITAHGQMGATELDDRMTAFYDGQYDVLLATNIIESGIDIPSANTMVVHRADMFGLAQLYQIRGRIGRSKVRAYAYLTYEPHKKLTDSGQKRLEVMSTLDTLGAGFQLASHDMDIRGAGNLVGDAQSGHIREVGVELYHQMLEEAVAVAREGYDLNDVDLEKSEQNWSPQINLGTSVLIPETYVEDLGVRMTLYRRLSELHDQQDVEAFAAELIDRFGDLPNEVENLLDIVKIKQLCKDAGVDRVDVGPKGAVIGFHNDTPPNLQGLVGWMNERKGTVKLRSDNKLSAPRSWDKPDQRVKGVRMLLKELAGL